MTAIEWCLAHDTNHEINPNIVKEMGGSEPVEETFNIKFTYVPSNESDSIDNSNTDTDEPLVKAAPREFLEPDKTMEEILDAMREEKMFKVTLNIDDIPSEMSAFSFGSREFLAYATSYQEESEGETEYELFEIRGILDVTDKKSEILGDRIIGKFVVAIRISHDSDCPEGKFYISMSDV